MEDKKEKNKGGRPRVEGREKNKFEIKCYLNFNEIVAFDNYKKQHSLKTSEVVRNSVLKELKISQKKTPKLTPEILTLFHEIERTNHSLNQIAKLLNTGLQLDGKQTLDFFKTISLLKKNSTEIKNKLS
jgi:hypothetical protein